MRHLNLHVALAVPVVLAACASSAALPRTVQAEPVLPDEMSQSANDSAIAATVPRTYAGSAERPRATAGSTLLGGVLGTVVGKSMDSTDRTAYDKAAQRALETGEKQAWANQRSGHHGTIIPLRSYTGSGSRECRQYTQTVYIDGKPHAGFGMACRSSGGAWQVASK